MTTTLTRQRCWTHPEREAAARCPECERFFCRECVTEHDGRLLCAACLRADFESRHRQPVFRPGFWRTPWLVLTRAVQLGVSLFLAWFFFQQLGRQLTSLPDEFHVNALWDAAGIPGGD